MGGRLGGEQKRGIGRQRKVRVGHARGGGWWVGGLSPGASELKTRLGNAHSEADEAPRGASGVGDEPRGPASGLKPALPSFPAGCAPRHGLGLAGHALARAAPSKHTREHLRARTRLPLLSASYLPRRRGSSGTRWAQGTARALEPRLDRPPGNSLGLGPGSGWG